MEKKLRWISSRKHNPAVKYFYGNPVHTNPWTQCYSGSKCKTHPTCTFSSYNSNYQFNYLLNPLANQHLPEELFELHPRLALGALPHVQHPLCCPLRLESTLSSSLHLFLAPHGFDKDHILQYSVRNTDKIMVGKKKKERILHSMVPVTPISETIDVMGFCHSLLGMQLAGMPQGPAWCMCTCHLFACTSVGINAIIIKQTSANKVTIKTAFKFKPEVKSKKHRLQNILFLQNARDVDTRVLWHYSEWHFSPGDYP